MELIGTIITGVLTLAGVVITTLASHSRIQEDLKQEFKVCQAVTDTKLEALTDEVKKHNNFAQRMPVVEEQIKVINHRIADLEREVKNK